MPSSDPESWACIDCGFSTGPGLPTRGQMHTAFTIITLEKRDKINARIDSNTEAFYVKPSVWRAAHMRPGGGCLCIGCLEKRLGRELTPGDFPEHPFNRMPGTERLLKRRGMPEWYRHARQNPLVGD